MNYLLIILAFLFYLAVPTALPAQTLLDIDSLVQMAQAEDYSIQTMQLELERLQLENKITRSSGVPTLSANIWSGYSNGRYYDPLSNDYTNTPSVINSSGVTATWNIYNGGYTHIKTNFDNINSRIQFLNIEKRKKEIGKEVIALYTSIVQSRMLMKLYQQKTDLYQRESERLKELLLLERITFVDTSLLALTKIETENERLKLSYKLEQDLYQLSLLTNQNLDVKQIKDPEDYNALQYNLQDLRFTLYDDTLLLKSSSISYKIRQLELQRAGLNSALQKVQFRPSVKMAGGLYTGYSSNRAFLRSPTSSNFAYPVVMQFRDNSYASTSLNVYIPIFDRRNKYIQKQGKLNEDISRVEQMQTEKKIVINYQLSRKDLSIKYQRLKIATTQLSESKKIYSSFEARFAADRLRNTDLLKAKEKQIDWEINYYQSYFDFYKSLKGFELDYGNNLTL